MMRSSIGGVRRRLITCLGAVVLACAILPARPAYALSQTVYGVDNWFDTALAPNEQNVTDIDLFAVDGAPDDYLYLDVYKDGEMVAERVALRLGDFTNDKGDTVSSVIGVDITSFDPAATYHVQAFESEVRADGEPLLYDGVIQPIYGLFGEEDTTGSLIATRMVRGGENRVFVAHHSYVKDGEAWQLADENPVADPQGAGRVVYRYERVADEGLTAMAAHVYFVNLSDASQLVKAADVSIGQGGTLPVALTDTVKLGEVSYRVYTAQAQDYLGGEGVVDLTVPCVPLASASTTSNAASASASSTAQTSASELAKESKTTGAGAASSTAAGSATGANATEHGSSVGQSSSTAAPSAAQGQVENVETLEAQGYEAQPSQTDGAAATTLSLADLAVSTPPQPVEAPAEPTEAAEAAQGSEDVQEAIPNEENTLAGPSSTLRSDAVGSSIELQGNVLLGMISFLTVLMLFLVLYRDKDEGMDE